MNFDPQAFIASQSWRKARAQSGPPHSYIVRRKGNTDEEFDAMVRHIRENAVERVWPKSASYSKIYLYWYAPDGHRYWTMGWPVDETTIINRDENDPSRPLEDGERLPYSSPDGSRPVL